MVEDWVEASSCSCERVFSYVMATDFGQSTERMCEMLWATGKHQRTGGRLRRSMSFARPPSTPGSGSKGMWLRLKMVVCLGLLRSRICKLLWKRMYPPPPLV